MPMHDAKKSAAPVLVGGAFGWAQPAVRRLGAMEARNDGFFARADSPTLHFIGLAIRGCERHGGGDADWERLGTIIATRPRAEVLATVWPGGLGSLNLLRRCHTRLYSRRTYDRLGEIMGHPAKSRILVRAK